MTSEKTTAEEEKTTMEKVKETVMDDERPMEKKVPEAPFALVGLTYMLILGLIALAVGFTLWLVF